MKKRPFVCRVALVASGACVVLLLVAYPAGGAPGEPAPGVPTPKVSLPPYTFHLNIAMAMRHFPWLHFHMEGAGVYDPGQTYSVRFTAVPWFMPKQQHEADLSMLDPAMWPKRYTYQQIGQVNGETLFALHAIDDPSLKSATVALGPYWHARRVDASYADGTHIQMEVNSSDVNGFLLPTTVTAQIDEPHLALSANANFEDYDFNPSSPLPSPCPSPSATPSPAATYRSSPPP